MSMINKEPFITPEMIAAWNAGGGIVRQYPFDIPPSQFGGWGSLYFKDVTFTTDIDLTNRKVFIECDSTDNGTAAWVTLNLVGGHGSPATTAGLTAYQINVLFIRPTIPAGNVRGVLNVRII